MLTRTLVQLVLSAMLLYSLPSAAASSDGWYPQLYAIFTFGTQRDTAPHFGAQMRLLDADLRGQTVLAPSPLQLDWVPDYRYEARIGGVPLIGYRFVVDEASDSSSGQTEQPGFFRRHWLAVGAGAVGVAALTLGNSHDDTPAQNSNSGNDARVCVSDICNP